MIGFLCFAFIITSFQKNIVVERAKESATAGFFVIKKSPKLTIHYKNGNTFEQNVWYAHIEENMLIYTRYQNPAPAFQEPTRLTLEHIESFEVEPLPKNETEI